jgi:hypothetical protein
LELARAIFQKSSSLERTSGYSDVSEDKALAESFPENE